MTARKGFTLVELLIAVSLVLIIAGATIPSLTSYLRNQNIREAQQQLISDMRTTQVKALTGTLSDQDVGGDAVSYWVMNFTNDSNTYNYGISALNTNCSVAMVIEGTYTLGNGVKIYNAPGCIFFNLKNGDITGPLAWTSESYVIRVGMQAGDSENKEVLFNSAGLIYANN